MHVRTSRLGFRLTVLGTDTSTPDLVLVPARRTGTPAASLDDAVATPLVERRPQANLERPRPLE
jgi:hypothetical protein